MKNVSGTQGDDKVTLAAGEIFVSGPGNDDVIGVVGTGYAFWGAPGRVDIDLIKGVALDGYGGVDRVQGVTELHLPSTGARVVGSNADEKVFSFGGPSWIDLGDGFDTVVMYQLSSTNYAIRRKKDSVTLVSGGHTIELKNVETLQFTDREFNFFAKGNGPYFEYQYELYAFEENQISDGWWYQGVYNPPQLVSYFPQAVQPFDIDSDLDVDIVLPLNRGYRTGVDTRYNFLVLENESGQLKFNKALTDAAPFIAGARRTETIFIERYGSNAFVSVAHDTAIETETRYDLPWRYGDIAIMLSKPFKNITDELVPERTLPKSLLTGRNTAVDAHSLAIGDLNGDGMEDILVGELGVSVFALLQTKEGRFAFRADSFLESLASTWKEPTIANSAPGVLIDLHLTDLNGDGFDDLVVGWGHAIGLSRVFFNDGKGGFSALRSVALPESIYGANNDLHMKTFSEDFDKDGDTDLVILHTRYDPFYGGNYLQFVENTGREKFVDSTISRFGDPQAVNDSFLPRLQWTDFWQAIDLNNDGSLDIVGHEVASGTAFALMNNGRGYFVRELIPSAGKPIVWADFDDDKLFEIVTFSSRWIDSDGTRSTNTFAVYEMRTGTENSERAFDLDGNAGNAARTLATVFGKDALKNTTYAGIAISLFDQGMTKDQVSQVAIDAVFGANPKSTDVVKLLWKNLFNADIDASNLAYYSGLIDSKVMTAAQLTTVAADLDLTAQLIDLAGLSKSGWEYIPFST